VSKSAPKKPESRLSGAFGVAIDQGSGLGEAIARARNGDARPDDLFTFKRAVVEVLSPEASVILVDAEFGERLLPSISRGCDAQLAFEADVYRISSVDRITRLPEHLRVGDLPAMGVHRLKFFMHYAPRGDRAINVRKHELVRRLGAECADHGLEFLFEPLVYDEAVADQAGADFAALKPLLVCDAAKRFSDPSFGVDVLKLEIPVNLEFVAGVGEQPPVYSLDEAHGHFQQVGRSTSLPVVYLSAGVSFERFRQSLTMARQCGARFSGFMCGRAIWSDAIAVFGARGEAGLRAWLGETGLTRLRELKSAASEGPRETEQGQQG
jgi:tagatose 1,6-diphosphate aldolase